jgi:ferredoxin
MSVQIRIQDRQGNLIGQFTAEDKQSILQMAAAYGIDIPLSCGVGMCGICRCKILSGKEGVQIDKITTPVRELARDADGSFTEVFACIGGIKTDWLSDDELHEVVLEKDI